jgi:MerR family redox-sensitive transcriptional activator SoxR
LAELSIGDVAARTGLATSALRYYESAGLIPRAGRRSGRRVYDESILERLAIIDLAKRAGFTMAEIKRLVAGFARRTPPGERWRVLAEKKLVELEERIAEAERMKSVLRVVMRCECPTFDDCSRAMRS